MDLIVPKEKGVIKLWIHGVATFHSLLWNKRILDYIGIIDSYNTFNRFNSYRRIRRYKLWINGVA